jgi:NADH-quinone oxidoreductase subunit M
VIFAAANLLLAIQRILFNALDKRENAHMPDLNAREIAIVVPIVIAILWLGLYPAPVLRRMEPAAARVVEQVQRGAVQAEAPTATLAMKPEQTP